MIRRRWVLWSSGTLGVMLLGSACGDEGSPVRESGYLLRGTVRDSVSSGVLSGAVVRRFDPDLISDDTTGVDGTYGLAGLGGTPRGQLEVSRSGYRTRTVVMPDGATRTSGPPGNEWTLDVSLGVHKRSASVASDRDGLD
jgi:hypothetical protein